MNTALIDYYYRRGGGGSVTAEYQAVLDYAVLQGWTLPSEAEQTADNDRIVASKALGAWDKIDVLYKFTANSNFASINWKNPGTHTLTLVSSPTFTAGEGFNGNGTSSYINTNWNPATHGVNHVLNSASFLCKIFNHVTEAKFDFGIAPSFFVSSPLSYFRADDGFSSTIYTVNQAPSALISNGGNSAGFYHLKRNDSGNVYLFKNGVQVDTDADASTAVPSANMLLLCLSNGGTPNFFSTKKMSFWAAGDSLDGLESDIYSIWN